MSTLTSAPLAAIARNRFESRTRNGGSMFRSLLATIACVVVFAFSSIARAGELPPVDQRRVMIISVDGLRPDLALRGEMPRLHALLKRSSYTFWAETTVVSLTLPSHVSMLTGIPPQFHQIEWNRDLEFTEPVYPSRPTLFEMAHKAGFSTAMVTGKSKFTVLNKPGMIDYIVVPATGKNFGNIEAAEKAVGLINSFQPQVMFVHIPDVDSEGHGKGWGSPEQMQAIKTADQAIGMVLDALEAKGLTDKTLVIISADHGGAGRNHGAEDARSRHIPWIASGPNIRPDYDLTLLAELKVKTEDTCATSIDFLGIPVPDYMTGKAVTAIYDPSDKELLSGEEAAAKAKPAATQPTTAPAGVTPAPATPAPARGS